MSIEIFDPVSILNLEGYININQVLLKLLPNVLVNIIDQYSQHKRFHHEINNLKITIKNEYDSMRLLRNTFSKLQKCIIMWKYVLNEYYIVDNENYQRYCKIRHDSHHKNFISLAKELKEFDPPINLCHILQQGRGPSKMDYFNAVTENDTRDHLKNKYGKKLLFNVSLPGISLFDEFNKATSWGYHESQERITLNNIDYPFNEILCGKYQVIEKNSFSSKYFEKPKDNSSFNSFSYNGDRGERIDNKSFHHRNDYYENNFHFSDL